MKSLTDLNLYLNSFAKLVRKYIQFISIWSFKKANYDNFGSFEKTRLEDGNYSKLAADKKKVGFFYSVWQYTQVYNYFLYQRSCLT